ncbi:MAG: eukaryotic-like serine/threonine-protein kinase [Actinomycetota bacterium]|nr:eukaryotic-like serine/threonine-protein kinase [Actinomycetota bacterium]
MAERLLSGRYRIVRHVARGGMAEVYLGHDELLDRTVAIKVLIPERARDASFVERFRREAKAAAGLNHQNIVGVHDFGEDDGQYFMVMEYVDGPTLRDVIRSDGPMDPERATSIAAAIAAALAAAHAKKIIHRDVKPANVLISSATGTVKVADFGIARAAGAQEGLTMPGAVMGTATYLSPEQAQGLPLDARSDIYSLGMVLYEMLAGTAPFKGETPVAVAYKQLHEVPPAPSALNPAVSPALDALVARALSKDPDQRPASAVEFRAELLAVDHAPVPAGPGADATVMDIPTAGEPTKVAAPTSIITPPPRSPDAGPPPRQFTSDAVYRRRRAILLGILAVVVGALLLVLCTRDGGGGPTTVPSVVGLSVPDATTELDKAGLKPDVVVEDRAGTPDQVLEQRPAAGTRVEKGSKVTLVVPRSVTTTSEADKTTSTVRTTTTQAPATTAVPATTAAPATAAPTTAPVATTVPPTTVAPTTTT